MAVSSPDPARVAARYEVDTAQSGRSDANLRWLSRAEEKRLDASAAAIARSVRQSHDGYCPTDVLERNLARAISTAGNDSNSYLRGMAGLAATTARLGAAPYDSARPGTVTVVAEDPRITNEQIENVRAVLAAIDTMFAGELAPPSVEVRLCAGGSNGFLPGVIHLACTPTGDEDALRVPDPATIAHEYAHAYFFRHVRLPDGSSLTDAFVDQRDQSVNWSRRLVEATSRLRELFAARREAIDPAARARLDGEIELWEAIHERAEMAFTTSVDQDLAFVGSPVREYTELLSDAVAVVLCDDPAAPLTHSLRTTPTEMFPHDARRRAQVEACFAQRDFSHESRVRYYDLFENDPYTLLDATRRHLWRHYFGNPTYAGRGPEILVTLMRAMEPEIWRRSTVAASESFASLNRRLINRLDFLMGENFPIDVDFGSRPLTEVPVAE